MHNRITIRALLDSLDGDGLVITGTDEELDDALDAHGLTLDAEVEYTITLDAESR